jgi:GTP-binding protein
MEAMKIITHVDHGKTTLVDKIMYHCQLFRDNENTGDLILDNDLEREEVLPLECFVQYKGTKSTLLILLVTPILVVR